MRMASMASMIRSMTWGDVSNRFGYSKLTISGSALFGGKAQKCTNVGASSRLHIPSLGTFLSQHCSNEGKKLRILLTNNAKGNVLDDARRCLTVDLITVDEGVFEQGCHGVDVVFGHLADILKEKGERLEDTVLNVEFWNAVLVHQRRKL